MFEYAIKVLNYRIEDCEYKKNYPSLTAIAMSPSLENKISELKQAIEVLKREGKE